MGACKEAKVVVGVSEGQGGVGDIGLQCSTTPAKEESDEEEDRPSWSGHMKVGLEKGRKTNRENLDCWGRLKKEGLLEKWLQKRKSGRGRKEWGVCIGAHW